MIRRYLGQIKRSFKKQLNIVEQDCLHNICKDSDVAQMSDYYYYYYAHYSFIWFNFYASDGNCLIFLCAIRITQSHRCLTLN